MLAIILNYKPLALVYDFFLSIIIIISFNDILIEKITKEQTKKEMVESIVNQ